MPMPPAVQGLPVLILGQVFLRKVYAVFDPGDLTSSGSHGPAVWLADQADPEIRKLQQVGTSGGSWAEADDAGRAALHAAALELALGSESKLKIQWDVVSKFYGGALPEVEIQRLQAAHVWLDYFSIPQQVDGFPGTSAEHQLKYIEAIPTFVGHCDVFLALVPRNTRSDTGLLCDYNSWLERGWCRTELWCHVLSARSKHPFVVVKSHDSAQYTAPLWHRYPVHMGDFTVEEDRARCCQVLQTALANYVSQLLHQNKSKTAYRLYLSLFEEMTGLEPKCRSVEDFLREFSFSTVAQRRDRSLSPVACAALSGDCRLVRALVIARASLHSHAPAMPELLHQPEFTPLRLAVWFKSHDLCMLETLLDLRADPKSSGINLPTPLGFCRSVGAVDLLVQRGAGVNFCGASFTKHLPIHSLSTHAAPCEVLARMIELRADVHGGRGGFASASPLHCLAHAGWRQLSRVSRTEFFPHSQSVLAMGQTSAVGCHEVGIYDVALEPRPLTTPGDPRKVMEPALEIVERR
eukprot:Skav234306  [mRNA]  locus=scaffold1018:265644:284621:+ [translate_table: standard]